MRRFVVLLLACAAVCAAAVAPSTASAAFTQCPAVDKDTSCQFLVTVTDAETTVESDPGQGPYEGADDALIGIQNNSSKPISSIPFTAEVELFGFENDGICSPGEGPIAPGCEILTETRFKGKPVNKSGKPAQRGPGGRMRFPGTVRRAGGQQIPRRRLRERVWSERQRNQRL